MPNHFKNISEERRGFQEERSGQLVLYTVENS